MLAINELIWDSWNKSHIARHDVTTQEVEEVCANAPTFAETYSDRVRVVGPTKQGRMLTIILAPKGSDVFYPVTARTADRKERREYSEQKEGE